MAQKVSIIEQSVGINKVEYKQVFEGTLWLYNWLYFSYRHACLLQHKLGMNMEQCTLYNTQTLAYKKHQGFVGIKNALFKFELEDFALHRTHHFKI